MRSQPHSWWFILIYIFSYSHSFVFIHDYIDPYLFILIHIDIYIEWIRINVNMNQYKWVWINIIMNEHELTWRWIDINQYESLWMWLKAYDDWTMLWPSCGHIPNLYISSIIINVTKFDMWPYDGHNVIILDRKHDWHWMPGWIALYWIVLMLHGFYLDVWRWMDCMMWCDVTIFNLVSF